MCLSKQAVVSVAVVTNYVVTFSLTSLICPSFSPPPSPTPANENLLCEFGDGVMGEAELDDAVIFFHSLNSLCENGISKQLDELKNAVLSHTSPFLLSSPALFSCSTTVCDFPQTSLVT